ncbi:MAG: lipopolysaccharide transport periplasmic protein LptA [Legionellaceae bacterium]|nr:lipopolysaccharide transport periplasmic protein LptA [Legionellaceae bacterium]
MVKSIYQYLLFFLCANFLISSSYALTSDRLESIQFQAGHVTFNDKTGSGTYSGGVIIDQGSSHLRANHAKTQMDEKHHLTLATAFGNPQERAHFWTLTTTDKPLLHAYADKICYDPLKHQLELTGHAYIIQGKNKLSAPHILYDTEAERFITTAKNKERTIILIDPTEHPEKHL